MIIDEQVEAYSLKRLYRGRGGQLDRGSDPYSAFNFNFLLEIEGVTLAGFSEVSGLSTETDVNEYRIGSEDITVRKLPGLKKITNISMKRGYTDSKELWNWRKTVLDGKTERRSGSIVFLNEAREPVLRWNFREGWPGKLEVTTFNANNNEVAIETLELVVEDIQMA